MGKLFSERKDLTGDIFPKMQLVFKSRTINYYSNNPIELKVHKLSPLKS